MGSYCAAASTAQSLHSCHSPTLGIACTFCMTMFPFEGFGRAGLVSSTTKRQAEACSPAAEQLHSHGGCGGSGLQRLGDFCSRMARKPREAAADPQACGQQAFGAASPTGGDNNLRIGCLGGSFCVYDLPRSLSQNNADGQTVIAHGQQMQHIGDWEPCRATQSGDAARHVLPSTPSLTPCS